MSGTGIDYPTIIFSNLTGPGDPSLYSCWASHTTWRTEALVPTVHTYPYSTSLTRWANPSLSSTVNACDGITRVSGVPTTTVTVTYTNATMVETSYGEKPEPACSITKQADCSTLYQVFSSLSSSWMSSYDVYTKAHSISRAVLSIGALVPPCTRDSDAATRLCPASYSTATSVECRISASHPTVFYWPTKADICNSNPVAPTVVTGGPTRTAVLGSATITSPTALLIMSDVHAMSFSVDGTAIPYYQYMDCVRGQADTVSLLINESDLSSATNIRTAPAAPFNFADLDAAPGSLYFKGRTCTDSDYRTIDCPNTIWDDYTPVLMMPTALKSGMPSNCRLESTFFWPATYVPITSDTVAMPSVTNWGATPNETGLRPTPVGGSRIKREMPIETGKANVGAMSGRR